MYHRVQQRAVVLTMFVAGLFGPGGCPLMDPLVGGRIVGPAPGTYYVERIEGNLFYYELAEWRGVESRWVALDDEEGTWFTGPGFYELSDNYVWSRDEDAEGLTLDDVIQLHDPPPSPDETR